MYSTDKLPEINRLIEFLKVKKMKMPDLAEEIGVPLRTLNNFTWNNKPFSGTVLRRLNETYGLSIDWLVFGQGDMFASGEVDNPILPTDLVKKETLIPYYKTIDAKKLTDYWWLVARAAEQSLITSGATPGVDYSRLDLYRLVQPLVLEQMRSQGLDVDTAEFF